MYWLWWLLFLGTVIVALGMVFLFIAEIAKKLGAAQEKNAGTVVHSSVDMPAEQNPDNLPVANDEYLERLTNAIAAQNWGNWNQWRRENPSLTLDLRNVDLSNTDLSFANLSNADLSGANLRNANLSTTNLSGTNLIGADLTGARLEGTNFTNALVDASGIKGAEIRPGQSVSITEKSALGLFKSGKTKREKPQSSADLPSAGKSKE